MAKRVKVAWLFQYISRIVGDLEMPINASVVRINPTVVPFAEKVFTLGGVKVIVGSRFL